MHEDPDTKASGDCDPVDICDIGSKVHDIGAVIQVKLLGTLAMIDEGETDWKVIAIDVTDPLAEKLDDIDDVYTHMPGLIEATHDWFRTYKMPGSDNPPNEFAFNGKAKNKEFAVNIIKQTNDQWKSLIQSQDGKKCGCKNTTVADSPHKVAADAAVEAVKGLPISAPPAALPEDVDLMYYLSSEQKMER